MTQSNPQIISLPDRTDAEYYNSLVHYQPLFYSGQGAPYFMTSRDWKQSFNCLSCVNFLFMVIFVFFIIRIQQNQHKLAQQNIPMVWVLFAAISIFVLANISFALTQLMNPGIINPATITQQQFQKEGKIFCKQCKATVLKSMHHCEECETCIWGIDHHCGFFNKCIGGYQKWAFYATLTFGFAGFVLIIMLVGFMLL